MQRSGEVDEEAEVLGAPAATSAGAAARSPLRQAFRRLVRNRLSLVGLCVMVAMALVALLAPRLAPYNPLTIGAADPLAPPTWQHLMGTDQFGRDILSRVIFGARISMSVGIVAVGISTVAGGVLGLISGYLGRTWDMVIGRVFDILLAFPAILLAIAIMAALGTNIRNVMIAIGVVNTPIFGRVVRAGTLSVNPREFVDASRAAGAPTWYVIVKHVVPNVLPSLIVQATVAFAWAVIAEAGLSFLGLGTQPPTPSWGLMLNDGRALMAHSPWEAIFAGACIMVAVFAFNVVGDGLRDAFDPRNQ